MASGKSKTPFIFVNIFVFFCISVIFIGMKQKDLSTIRIDKQVYKDIKAYCDARGLKIYKWVASILKNEMSK